MMIEMIYLTGLVFTFLYAIWRGAAHGQLHDPLEWIVSVAFAIAWPLIWLVVWSVLFYFKVRKPRQ